MRWSHSFTKRYFVLRIFAFHPENFISDRLITYLSNLSFPNIFRLVLILESFELIHRTQYLQIPMMRVISVFALVSVRIEYFIELIKIVIKSYLRFLPLLRLRCLLSGYSI